MNGPEIYEELYEFRLDVGEVHRRLAYDLQRFWDGNDVLLTPVRGAFRLAAWALALEVVGLLLLASGTLSIAMADKATAPPPPPPPPTPNIGLPEVRGSGPKHS